MIFRVFIVGHASGAKISRFKDQKGVLGILIGLCLYVSGAHRLPIKVVPVFGDNDLKAVNKLLM